MDIRFISSLTADDESQLAKALIGAVAKLLEPFSIAYTIRIETATNQVFDHHHTPIEPPRPAALSIDGRAVAAAMPQAVKSVKFESA